MRFDVITLFPEMFAALDHSITGRALNKDLLQIKYWNPRDYTKNKHHQVDDRPYGGGPGMVIMTQPLHDTIMAAKQSDNNSAKVIHLSPQGKLLNQSNMRELATQPRLILVTGRYEGIDERIVQTDIDEEWSIGDYILSGGELAAMVMIDAITRLLPGSLGHEASAEQDSFSKNLLDYPHYTRPEGFNGQNVPKVLLSGNHENIARWRLKQALGRTFLRRPDLLRKHPLTKYEQELLTEFINEQKERGQS